MNSGTPYIGTKISLISKSEIKYEGILYAIDTKNATVTLANVRSFGTEDREVEKYIPPRDEQFEFIVFRGQDIKDLHVCEAPQQNPDHAKSHLPQDPAIVQTGLPNSGYSHFHTPPVSYPQVPSYGPFGGLPTYPGYPPGMGHRPLPGRMQPHMGMMAPGPMLPQRIGTPPSVPPMAMARSHTPSPETVLPVSSHSSTGTARAEDTQTKSTSQQGTQTVSTKKKPSSRPSSRRNSEDKTAQSPQAKKKEEVKVEKETTNKETSSKETSSKETTVLKQAPQPQRQRQGGNRRSQGRRGGSTVTAPRSAGPVKFEGEFDFESSNAKFNKEEIEEELQQKLHENLRITNEDENAVNGTFEADLIQDRAQSPVSYYDSSKSFFDSISCEAMDRDKNRRVHPSWQQERKVNMETFGVTGDMRQGGRWRGRGRGGFRGGRGSNRNQGRDEGSPGGRGNQGRDEGSQGGRGVYRGGRGGQRRGRSRVWMDSSTNREDKIPSKSLNKRPPVTSSGDATAKA
ncbi:protein LSM14 homolog A-B-like [Montipora capricornis]|uniref:protein LSM14 homolog A-B-like n=1 Tax=Montipora capricornis TaxID=246305 RepID=UPI0035F11F7B